MKTIEQTRRELFEAWRLENFSGGEARLIKCSNAPDVYYYAAEQAAWRAFNAALDAVVIAIPPEWPPVCEKDEGANEMRDAVLDAIESTNLGLKIR